MKLNSKLNPAKFFRTRNSIPVEELDPIKCENCGQEFKGHFCPNCGQEVAEFNRPFGFVLYDFMGNFFAFDTRFFQTFKFLLLKPGFLSSEFFKGRRVRYSPPFRNFVFLSFILFVLLQILTEQSLDKAAEEKVTGTSNGIVLNSSIKINSEISVLPDSAPNVLQMLKDSLAAQNINIQDSTVENLNLVQAFQGSANFRESLNKLADKLELKLKKTTDPDDRKKLTSFLIMCRTPELAISNIMKYLSWAFFILLPLFGLILKFFYIRRDHLYIRHLIFSIHVHSYLFFILIIIVSLNLLFDSGVTLINGLLLATFPVYLILALRKFYGQNLIKVILKFIGISVIYNVLLWSAVIIVFTKTLGLI